jgi:hypothetical protein
MGSLGMQKIVPLRNALTVQDMVDNSVKVWLLSQYSQRKTTTDCVNLNLLENTERIEIMGRNVREIEERLRVAFIQVFDSEAKSNLKTANAKYAFEDLDRVKKLETL